MIHEAYVSFEVAKLLKEKGFDVPCRTCYDDDDNIHHEDVFNWNNSILGETSAPTHQMALAWLREVKGMYISIRLNGFAEKKGYIGGYWWVVDILNKETEKWIDNDIREEKYEDVVEAAIKYVLENLI